MSEALVAVRAGEFASSILCAGSVFFWSVVAAPALARVASGAALSRQIHRQCSWLLALSLAGAIFCAIAWLVLLAADLNGSDFLQAQSPRLLWTVLGGTSFGSAWIVRALIAATLVPLTVAFGSDRGGESRALRWPLIVLSAAFLGSLAWSGHAAGTEQFAGALHRFSDIVHLIAAGAWVGGLVPLALFLHAMRPLRDDTVAVARRAVLRFSTLGVLSVAALLVSGLINTWFLAGNLPALLGTQYGHWLLAKIALFAGMLMLAGINRWRLTPRIAPAAPAAGRAFVHLSRNCWGEAALGLAVVFLVAALGTLPPGLHDQPWWPLPFRFTADAFYDRAFRNTAVIATTAAASAALAILGTLIVRRRMWSSVLVLVGGAALVFGARDFALFTTGAYPTSFYAPAVGYSAQSIVLGRDLFAAHCAACHGSEGRGDGPAAKALTITPADLTADHVYGHTDGDLFWLVTNGVGEVMPAFGRILDADARWHIVNFIHANADAVRLAALRGRVTYAAFPAPVFSAECPDGQVRTAEDFRGRPVHFVMAGANSAARLRQLSFLAKTAEATTIVIALAPAPADERNFCVTSDQDVIDALALYRRDAVTPLDGFEFLVDSLWQIRAVWRPGLDIDWIDPFILRRNIAEMSSPQVLPGNLTALNSDPNPPAFFPSAAARYHAHQH